MPGTTFCSVEEEVYWTVRNTRADTCSAALRATPLWDGPGGPEAKAAAQTMTADPLYLTYPLAAGELQSGRAGSGGVSGTLGEDLDYFLGPDTFRAVLTVDGREQELTLTRTYTTPDGGSYTLPGEEDIP